MTPFTPATLASLLRADAINVGRDPVLMVGVVLSLLPAPLLMVFGEAADAASLASLGFADMSDLLATIAIVMAAAMLGWVAGFLLLEDRDEAVLMALQITPIGRDGFVAYRLIVCFTLVFALALLIARLTLPDLPLAAACGAAAIAGGHAVATALFLLAFAANKVEGLALTKLVNLALLAPALALAPAPLRYCAGILPPFWIGEIAGLASDALAPPLAAALGTLATLTVVAGLGYALRRRLG